jgi:myosin-5
MYTYIYMHAHWQVTGECGAGKSEVCRLVIKQLVSVGSSSDNSALCTNIMCGCASTLLQAFGNATTVINPDSSRFYRATTLLFDSEFRLCGARLDACMLERSRVTRVPAGERCFHVIHQLAAACVASHELAVALGVSDSGMSVLTQGASHGHFEAWIATVDAMMVIGMEKSEMVQVTRVVAALKLLMAVSFQDADTRHPHARVRAESEETCEDAARLLDWDGAHEHGGLAKALCTVHAGSETQVLCQLASQAAAARDSLVQALYMRLFDWIVTRIQTSLAPRDATNCKHTISILDIVGFANLQRNSLEQLYVNYANEKLHGHVSRHVLKIDQEEYMREGITWARIDHPDNSECISIIEHRSVMILCVCVGVSVCFLRCGGCLCGTMWDGTLAFNKCVCVSVCVFIYMHIYIYIYIYIYTHTHAHM